MSEVASESSAQGRHRATSAGRYSGPRVAVVVSGWPRISEVFALNEVLALHRAGMLAAVLATKPGDAGLRHPAAEELDELVTVLPDGDAEEQGTAAARLLHKRDVAAVHGYFAHRPAAVAEATARRLGARFGFSTHALDVRRTPPAELARLASRAAVVLCCNADAAADLRAAGVEPELMPHGVDTSVFTAAEPPRGPVVELLAVGRFVEKKGFDVLVEAMARVRRPCRLTVVGDGPLRPDLEAAIAARGLCNRVELGARRTHAELPARYAAADVVVVPSVVDSAGDRDGLPNVVLEAMACARPVVASDVAAIGTAVLHDVTGVLVPPRDPQRLADALDALVDDGPRRAFLGRAGRAVVEDRFDLTDRAAQMCGTLERRYA
jgi:glycosyltransferase involved in cell wall biosynthesis